MQQIPRFLHLEISCHICNRPALPTPLLCSTSPTPRSNGAGILIRGLILQDSRPSFDPKSANTAPLCHLNHSLDPQLFLMQDPLGNTVETPLPKPPATSFADFPVEILIDIFSNLSPVDLKVLRLVCRKWNHAVLDKTAWTKAFRNRFGTGTIFASVTGSHTWLPEYFGRVSALKLWAKAKAVSQLYQLINSEYGVVDLVQADFFHDRLMTFSRASGSVSMCSLTLGKNQVYIPENLLFTGLAAFDANWTYLCVGKATGEIYLKNLMTATASASRLSVTQFEYPSNGNYAIVGVKINADFDKHKELADVVSLSADGTLRFWSLGGVLKELVVVQDDVLWLDTDFKLCVVVLSPKSVHVVDFASKESRSFDHGWHFQELLPVSCHVDFGDCNVVMCSGSTVRVFNYFLGRTREGCSPEHTSIIDGTIQTPIRKRNPHIAGGDGLLYAVTLSDGSVGVFNIRDDLGSIRYTTRIMPFSDLKAPRDVARYTKVALNSVVIAIGALADFVHIHDAHSGEYLREGTKVARRLTRHGTMPILKIEFGPGASGVIVSGDVVQYFRFGEEVGTKKKPNAPQALEVSRRAMYRHIKAQMEDYDSQRHQKWQQERMADKYNGTRFTSEQEELRVAMALSASCTEEQTEDEELKMAIALSERESTEFSVGSLREGRLRDFEDNEEEKGEDAEVDDGLDEEERDVLRRVLELLLVDH